MDKSEEKLLYVFVTHQAILPEARARISSMMDGLSCEDYVIVCGSEVSCFMPVDRTLFLACNDGYEGLPEKVLKAYRELTFRSEFDEYTHFVKLDCDTIIQKLLPSSAVKNIHYGGVIYDGTPNRYHHVGRCGPSSRFNYQPYFGPVVPWCLGGCGYVISREAVNLIKNDETAKDRIYEDLYVALMLHPRRIYPSNIKMGEYLISEHNV